MLPEWMRDKARFDPFMRDVKSRLGLISYRVTDVREDQDGIDLVCGAHRVALRGRSVDYLLRYPHDITFRAWRKSGVQTEWSKCIENQQDDLFFYFFADEGAGKLCAYTIIHLPSFRAQWFDGADSPPWVAGQSGLQGRPPVRFEDRDNRDGTGFRAVDTRGLVGSCIKARWMVPSVVRASANVDALIRRRFAQKGMHCDTARLIYRAGVPDELQRECDADRAAFLREAST